MIAFFPEIYPDELLYSQIARYHSRTGYSLYASTVADIYAGERFVHPSVDFVNRFTDDAMQWITKDSTWEDIAEKHTMYPAYVRFLPKLRRSDAVNGILSCEGNWKNLMCLPNTTEKRYIRYCPECAKEDREKYGETYWHRAHQIPRIRVCPMHRCFLENSEITISSKTSPGLYDAENNVPSYEDSKACSSDREIEFIQYVINVMNEKIDLESSLSVGAFLHSRLESKYTSDSGLVKNISQLYEDYLTYYDDTTQKMTFSYAQKIFNGYRYDPYFILQLAYFMGISVQEITHLPSDIPLYGLDNGYQELSLQHNVDFAIVKEIGSTVLQFSHNQTRVSKKSGRRSIQYDELDAKYLTQVKTVVKQILSANGRPEKVSFAKVQKALNLPQKQINKLPKCKAYIEKHIEPQPHYWARVIEWAAGKLVRENKHITLSQIMKKTNMRKNNITESIQHIQNNSVKELLKNII